MDCETAFEGTNNAPECTCEDWGRGRGGGLGGTGA